MAKDTKTVFKGFDYQNCDDFAAYLRKMSAKGWHFRQWGAGLIFERGEPQDIEYAVEVFVDGTEYDTRPEINTREFAEYCGAAGWQLLDAKRKFCIFEKIRPDAVPILTPEERLANTVKAMRGNIWSKLGLGAWFVFLQWTRFSGSQFAHQIFFPQNLMIAFVWGVLFLSALIRCVQFYWWQYTLRKALDRGEPITLGRGKGMVSFTNGWYTTLVCVLMGGWMCSFLLTGQYRLLLYFLGMIAGLLIMGYCIAKFRPDSTTNQIIQVLGSMAIVFGGMVFSVFTILGDSEKPVPVMDIPLRYEDIGCSAGELQDSHLEHSGSIFGSRTYCRLDYEEEYVYYYIYESQYNWILDRIWEEEASARYNQAGTDCTALWGAVEAYRNGNGTYMVRYPDVILTFDGDKEAELTAEQIHVIRQALIER